MEVKVQLNNLRTAPRKVRQVADIIRKKNLSQARMLLEFTTRGPAESMLKLLNSAAASAVNDLKLNEKDLFISKITVDQGPTLKRMFPMSRGRAYPIMKRTSHVVIILSDGKTEEKEVKKEKKAVVTEEPKKEVKPKRKPKAKK